MKYLPLYILCFLCLTSAQAQTAPSIIWQASYGGEAGDYATDIIYTINGNLVMCGNTSSKNFYINIRKGKYTDFMLLNIDVNNSALNWSQVYGGSSSSVMGKLYEVDKGFFVAGYITGGGKDVTRYDSSNDFWSIKTDYYGKIVWDRTLGGSGYDFYKTGMPTKDGGYIYAGQTNSTDGDVINPTGKYNNWIVKTSSIGSIEWQKIIYGDTGIVVKWPSARVAIEDIQQTKDEGFILTGFESDTVSLYADAMAAKLDKHGNVAWKKKYGGDSTDVANSIKQTLDGGYILAGYSKSSNKDVDTNYGDNDVWIVKLNSSGGLEWQKTYGGSRADVAREIIPCIEGGYLFVGTTASNDGMVTGNHSIADIRDAWAVKIDDTGKILWQKCLGGTDEDFCNAAIQLPDASFVLAGGSKSQNGDVTSNAGDTDAWIVKLSNPAASVERAQLNEIYFSVYPNPCDELLNVQLKEKVVGTMQLLDVKGRLLYSSNIDNKTHHSINTATITAGIYTLVVRAEDGWLAKQIIIQH
ncbi:MAG: T9SS type A sorting domain-containing protein [Flavipsychrobacter sp.]